MSGASRWIQPADAGCHTSRVMTELDLELAALRERRMSTGLVPWLRSLRPFDRRSIREPDARDVYWVNVQRRLAESDAAFLTHHDPYESADGASR
jgi:hypothetical protein